MSFQCAPYVVLNVGDMEVSLTKEQYDEALKDNCTCNDCICCAVREFDYHDRMNNSHSDRDWRRDLL